MFLIKWKINDWDHIYAIYLKEYKHEDVSEHTHKSVQTLCAILKHANAFHFKTYVFSGASSMKVD